jgi:hypothetical protein
MTEDNRFGFAGPSEDARQTRRMFQIAGAGYGLLFGLGFALFAWGYDAYLLYQSGAALPWSKLVIGLPLAVVIGGLVGWLAALTPTIMIPVVMWAIACGLLAAIAAHLPFEGTNVVVWLVDRRFWNENLYSYNSAAATRTTLMVFISVLLGAFVGFIQTLAMQWAWDRTSDDGRMTMGSWSSLLIALPVALLPALTVNSFMNGPLRYPQTVVSDSLQLALSGAQVEDLTADSQQANLRSLKPYLEQLSDEYETYFVSFSDETGSWHSAYIDVVFDNGLVLRCVTVGNQLVFCDDFEKRLHSWVGELARAGIFDERPWLEPKMRHLDVTESTIDWLQEHRDQLSESFQVQRESQQSGWIYVHVAFDTGFEMVCRFRDVRLTVVDKCYEVSNTLQ